MSKVFARAAAQEELLEQNFQLVSKDQLPKVNVVNILATVTYPKEDLDIASFNLKHIFQSVSLGFEVGEEVEKKVGKGRVTLFFKKPFPATVNIFRTCQFTLVSVKSEEELNVIVSKVHNFLVKTVKYRQLKDTGYTVNIRNITATYALDTAGSKLCLDKLSQEAHKIYWRLNNSGVFSNILIDYEPELFPGLQWYRRGFVANEQKVPFEKVVISAFSSGKMTITGSGDINKICFTLKELLDFIEKHRDELIPRE